MSTATINYQDVLDELRVQFLRDIPQVYVEGPATIYERKVNDVVTILCSYSRAHVYDNYHVVTDNCIRWLLRDDSILMRFAEDVLDVERGRTVVGHINNLIDNAILRSHDMYNAILRVVLVAFEYDELCHLYHYIIEETKEE